LAVVFRPGSAVLGQQVKLVALDATVVVLKKTGHWVLEENPRETTDALMKFCETGQRAAASKMFGRYHKSMQTVWRAL
jgi:hypothetical protein